MRTSRTKTWIGLAALVALIGLSLLLPIADWAVQLVERVRELGVAGVAVYAALYVVATVLMIPGSLLTLGAGFLYGLAGAAVVWPASVLGASAAFLLARALGRKTLAQRLERSPKLAAIDASIGDASFAIIVLLRLSPVVPFNALNYGLGLTKARFRAYFAATAIGMIPGIFLYVYLGSLITEAAQLASGDTPDAGLGGQLLLYGGLVATLAATVVITRLARARLRSKLFPA